MWSAVMRSAKIKGVDEVYINMIEMADVVIDMLGLRQMRDCD